MIFQYAHLLKGSIRLVRFHPDSTPASISLTLEHEAKYQDHNVHFTALAYEAAKSGGEMKDVLLQGRTRRVPRTLWQALSLMVQHHDTSGRFWIDYVCVNQNNEAEKLDHKARLPSIYASADKVLLWLNSGDTVAGAERDVVANGSDSHSSEFKMSLESTKNSNDTRSTVEKMQLQQAQRILLLQGSSLVELRKSDPQSALQGGDWLQ